MLTSLLQQNYQITLAIRNKFLNEFNLPIKIVKISEIDQKTNWTESLKEMDVIIHLAARAHQLNDQAINPEAEFIRINCEGTKNLAKQAIAAGVKHVIFISSIGAMATLSDTIISEESPCQPDTPYGRSKLNEIGRAHV